MTTAHTTQQFSLKSRSSSLDLIKWLAMLTMVIDHLRLVWPEMSNLLPASHLVSDQEIRCGLDAASGFMPVEQHPQ
jgi:hypothetical protein